MSNNNFTKRYVITIVIFICFISFVIIFNNVQYPDHLQANHMTDLFGISADAYLECTDPLWCNIPMPEKSYFRFPDPPTNRMRWKKAQIQASKGEQILLQKILPYFPTFLNFIDGDVDFRSYYAPCDYFLDENIDFRILNKKNSYQSIKQTSKHSYSFDGKGTILPDYYNIQTLSRAPVLHLGYFAYSTEGGARLFQGRSIGEAIIDTDKLIRLWSKDKDKIEIPWIGFHSANENWGILSTIFPNRTIDWGKCCDNKDRNAIYDILNHEKTVMLLVNQHHNITHPKLITLPRGLPIQKPNLNRLVWDMMHQLVHKSKTQLIFTASSTWGYRPKIVDCISKKFKHINNVKFLLYDSSPNRKSVTTEEYYKELGSSYFSVAVPGLGYDTYRLWEALTIGTIPIIEKGVGFDKTLWKLPALLVDDFDDVTPELLRVAYIEALYRADEFEFERLTMSFWWDFIFKVSKSMDPNTILEKFPIEAEDPHFTRPLEPFQCTKESPCGPETKQTPKSYC